MLRTLFTLILISSATSFEPARAQVALDDGKLAIPYSELNTLKGYVPSLLASEASAQMVYQLLPTDIFTNDSWCYQRAHTWSTLLDEHYSIKSMKVFLYFTDRYRREFAYPWFFHTAPLIPTEMADGSIQELVFDPTFTSPPSWQSEANWSYYDNKPVSIQRWTRYFVYPNVDCKQVENYQEFLDGQDQYYCFVMKTPMYNYTPNDFVSDTPDDSGISQSGAMGSTWFSQTTGVRTGWRPGDLENMKKGLKNTN